MKVLALFLPEIREMLDGRDFRALRRLLTQIPPADLAEGWGGFSPQEQAAMFRLLPRRLAAQLFEELDPPEQERLLAHVREVDVRELLTDLEPADASQLTRGLPPKLTAHLMALMRKEKAVEVEQILHFPPESVGSLMHTRFARVRPGWTTRRALEVVQLRTRLRQIDETYLEHLYVTDEEERLQGLVALKALVVAPSDMTVADLMRRAAVQLAPEADREEAANLFRRYKPSSCPVVGGGGRLLGILLVKDVLDIIEAETEEDFAKMAGTRVGLLSQPAWAIVRVRFPWLIATCVGYFAVGWVVQLHEETLAQVIGLASFMPLIAAMGGNVGSQTATVIVRGMATGELKDMGFLDVLAKEVLVGAALGILYGAGAAIIAHLAYGARFGWRFSWVVGAGMFASMTTASAMGTVEPYLFHRLKIDPATATGPLITLFADLVSTATYLTVAAWLFGAL